MHNPLDCADYRDVSGSGTDELLKAWRDTVRAAGAPAEVGEAAVRRAGMELLDWWGQPHRQYHTIAHLVSVLSIIDGFAGHAVDADLVRLAAWGHDAVYDPRAPEDENERASARLAGQLLAELRVPPPAISEVLRLVLLTASHEVGPDDHNGDLLCDADLAILAAEPEQYQRYTLAVRREYGHMSDDDFHAARLDLLRELLQRPNLYRIPALRTRWEQAAWMNLRRELWGLNGEEAAELPRHAAP
jgi:predicted metal-dependent HD superfamily phosphohydrolase